MGFNQTSRSPVSPNVGKTGFFERAERAESFVFPSLTASAVPPDQLALTLLFIDPFSFSVRTESQDVADSC